MKISYSFVSTSVVCMGFSLGLLACGSNSSSSNPGLAGAIGGEVNSIPAGCPNTTLSSNAQNPVSDASAIPHDNYTLSHLTMYVYNPATGDSFSALADAHNGFNPTYDCNKTTEAGRHSETASAPKSLDSSRQVGPEDQDLKITADFDNTQIVSINSTSVPDHSGYFAFDHIGRGRELIGSDTYVTYQIFLAQNGGLEIRTMTESPVDPTSGTRKLVFTSGQYSAQGQPNRPGPQPGGPGHH